MKRLCAMLMALAIPAWPQAVPKLAFEHYKLPNGLQVILYVNRKAPVVHVNLRFHAGSKYELPGRTGFAHLFEHLLFQGYERQLEPIGATDVNGSTTPDYTEYYETVPSERLERMLWLESNRFVGFLGVLTQQSFENQREVVRNERRQTIENQPYGQLYALLHEHAFPPGHPYAHETLGSHRDLLAATLDDVRDFYRTYYTPGNLTLALAGDFDPAQARQWIAKYFGSMPAGDGIARPARSIPKLSEPKSVEVWDRVPRDKIYISWPTPGGSAFELAVFVLNNGGARMRGALTHASLCREISIETYTLQDASLFNLGCELMPGVPVAKVGDAVSAEIARLLKEGPTQEELERAKNNLEFQQLSQLETLYGAATALSQIDLLYGDPDHFTDWASRYSKVTAEEIQQAAARWLDTPNRLAIQFHPISTGPDPTPEPDRRQPPPFQTVKPYKAPEVKSARLPNGLEIFAVERRELPRVSVQVRLKIGATSNPPGKLGLGLITTTSSKRETRTRTESQIEQQIADLAASFHGGVDGESISGGFEVLRKNLNPAMELLADMIRNPALSEGIIESEKKIWTENQKESAASADFDGPIAAILLGSGHPLAARGKGTVAAITARDAAEFHQRYWKPDVASLVFVGDINLEEAVALARTNFGDWTGVSAKPPALPAPHRMPGRVFMIDRKGAAQTLIVQFVPGVERGSSDYPALFLADQVWGGISSSRLRQNLRQDKGYAYSINSQLRASHDFGLWLAISPVETGKTKEALAEFVKELRGIGGERPITAEELNAAKSQIIQGYPGHFELAWSTADQISRNWALGLPTSNLEAWPAIIQATTLEAVNAAARKYAKPGEQAFLLIGDRARIEAGVRELKLGEIVMLTQDGSVAAQ